MSSFDSKGVGDGLGGKDVDAEMKRQSKAGSFGSLGLDKDLLSGLNRMGYKAPTPVQRKALPIALAGMDMVCMARTGSGKTCVFLVPLIQLVKKHDGTAGVRAVVLSPTRELALQTYRFAKDMAKFTDIRIASIIGGDPLEGQFEALAGRPDVLIATPGRLMHHLQEISTFKLKSVKYLVFDEADRLFEMGFAEQLSMIIKECPQERQTLLFSATMPKQLVQFSRAGLRDPQLVRLESESKLSDELRLAFFSVRSNEKMAALMYLVRRIIPSDQMTIIFTATRHHSELVHALLQRVGVRSTLVYGSMDMDARSANLRAFRTGQVSYLIVTDLAARGIDVPLLNNVINLHFPPTPKLFVHRCGRAARQGRIGFAFSLVEPEELAYMADVHLFLGKDVNVCDEGAAAALSPELRDSHGRASYTLENMTPQLIHTGLIPQDVLDEENEYLKRSMNDDDSLQILFRISENGMKQYRRTRTEASREGVKIAKRLTKAESIRTLHPLIVGCDPSRCSLGVVEKAEFVRMLQTFRPAQTVFETGIGLGTGSQIIKKKGKKNSAGETHGVQVMRELRRVTASALERSRVQPSATATDGNEDDEENNAREDSVTASRWLDVYNDDNDGDADSDVGCQDEFFDEPPGDRRRAVPGPTATLKSDRRSVIDRDATEEVLVLPQEKIRMSKAERKRIKKGGEGAVASVLRERESSIKADSADGHASIFTESMSGAITGAGTFRDSRFYMTYGTEDERANFAEASLQPQTGLRTHEAQQAIMLESALLDVAPDDALELNRKKRMMRWDAKKRKFVKQSLEEMSSLRGAKRLRTETGAIISKSARPKGEMYEKWQKKTRREVASPGMGDDDDDRPRPNVKVNSKVKDELKSAAEIRKAQKARADNKLKNMRKDKRKKIESKNRAKKQEGQGQRAGHKAGNRKLRAILRI